MLAILFVLASTPPMVVARNTRVEGLEVFAPRDSNLISRTVYSDGSIGECRRVAEEQAGWLNIECRTGPFLGTGVYEPVKPDPMREPRSFAPGVMGHPPFLRPLN
jgi:hypothetical protein